MGFRARVAIVNHADTPYDDLVVLHFDEFRQFRLAMLLTQAPWPLRKLWQFFDVRRSAGVPVLSAQILRRVILPYDFVILE